MSQNCTDRQYCGIHARESILTIHHAFDEPQSRRTQSSQDHGDQREMLPNAEVDENIQCKLANCTKVMAHVINLNFSSYCPIHR